MPQAANTESDRLLIASACQRPGVVAAFVLTVTAIAYLAAFGLGVPVPSLSLGGQRTWPFPLLFVVALAWWLVGAWTRSPMWVMHLATRALRVPPLLVMIVVTLGIGIFWYLLQEAELHLGHDEAVYATKARSWLTDAPSSMWARHRPVGLPLLGVPILAIESETVALRMVGLGLAILTTWITYFVAAKITTPRRAVVVVLVAVSGYAFLRRLPEFLNDIGAAGLMLAFAYLIIRAREPGARHALALAALIAVAAFYLRYGIASALLAICVAALIAWGPRAWLRDWRRVAVAGGSLLASLAPHMIYSHQVAGSPWAVLVSAGEVAGQEYVGDGLLYYAAIFPFGLVGDWGGVVMVAAVIATGFSARRIAGRAEVRAADRVRVFLTLSALLQVFVLGLTAHGEERFVILPILILLTVGVDSLGEATGQASRVVLGPVAVVSVIGAVATHRVVTEGYLATVTAERESIVTVAERLATTHPCLVVTSYEPEFEWYSGCSAMSFTQARRGLPADGRAIHFALFDRGRSQPKSGDLRSMLRARPQAAVTVSTDGSLGAARVITLPAADGVANHVTLGDPAEHAEVLRRSRSPAPRPQVGDS